MTLGHMTPKLENHRAITLKHRLLNLTEERAVAGAQDLWRREWGSRNLRLAPASAAITSILCVPNAAERSQAVSHEHKQDDMQRCGCLQGLQLNHGCMKQQPCPKKRAPHARPSISLRHCRHPSLACPWSPVGLAQASRNRASASYHCPSYSYS